MKLSEVSLTFIMYSLLVSVIYVFTKLVLNNLEFFFYSMLFVFGIIMSIISLVLVLTLGGRQL